MSTSGTGRPVLVVLGTRPEAVKLAPVVVALQRSHEFRPVVVSTGQHRRILDEVLDLFGIVPDHDLGLLRERQTLTHVTTAALVGLEPLLHAERPAAVLVQGDTTTTFAAALAAFYQDVPVVHLEAGLRTGDVRSPFPEEANRRLTSQLTRLHLAPTPRSRDNLLAEGVERAAIVVTGNTVIDALHTVVRSRGHVVPEPLSFLRGDGRRVVLVTSHRRESWDSGLQRVARALREVALEHPEVVVVFPVHPNPVVREQMTPLLDGLDNVHLLEPLGYRDFCWLLARAHVAVTDSGGVQEEAPSLGVPVLVTRATTERPEAVAAGSARLVGTDALAVRDSLTELLCDDTARSAMARAVSPYGDGRATERVVGALQHLLAGGPRPAEFRPAAADVGEAGR